MSNRIQDVLQLVRATLLANAALQQEVGNRVHVDHPKIPDAGTLPMPLLILEPKGGPRTYEGALRTLRLDLYAYSATNAGHALGLYEQAAALLQGARLALDNVSPKGSAREADGPSTGFNEVAQGWWARGSWVITTAG